MRCTRRKADLVDDHPSGRALAADFDHDPERFAANQQATRSFSMIGDVHDRVADRLAKITFGAILDLGGGNGALAKSLNKRGRTAIVVDRADYVHSAPRPAVQADATRLPFRSESFAAVAALWMLYYLDHPEDALTEVARVLRTGGTFVASTSSRYNDPEFASVLPDSGKPFSFDAETAPAGFERPVGSDAEGSSFVGGGDKAEEQCIGCWNVGPDSCSEEAVEHADRGGVFGEEPTTVQVPKYRSIRSSLWHCHVVITEGDSYRRSTSRTRGGGGDRDLLADQSAGHRGSPTHDPKGRPAVDCPLRVGPLPDRRAETAENGRGPAPLRGLNSHGTPPDFLALLMQDKSFAPSSSST